MYNGS